MSGFDKKDEKAIEREIRRGREFSLAEAIGQQGGGLISGGTPITPTEQVAHTAQQLIATHLHDPETTLRELLSRRIEDDVALLDRHIDSPEAAVAELVRPLLRSTYAIEELVRQLDMTWAHDMDERPHFQRHGQPPHPADVYTHDNVRDALRVLLNAVEA